MILDLMAQGEIIRDLMAQGEIILQSKKYSKHLFPHSYRIVWRSHTLSHKEERSSSYRGLVQNNRKSQNS